MLDSPDMEGVLRIHFGPYEVDARANELRKHGVRLRIRQQPLQILLMLLEKPGEIVLREEIRQRLWPDNTVVEFEHSINTAVQKLREVLGESASNPQYIETVTKRGYRFLGSVDRVDLVAQAPAVAFPMQEPIPAQPQIAGRFARPRFILACSVGAVLVCLLAAGGWLAAVKPGAGVRKWVLPVGVMEAQVSPDGTAVVWRDTAGLVLRRFDTPGETRAFKAAAVTDVPAWSPDGSQVAAATALGLYRVRVSNGESATICPIPGPTRGLTWSRNGTLLFSALTTGIGDLYTVPVQGGTPVRLEVPGMTGGVFWQPEFLPDGETFVFAWNRRDEEETGIYLSSLKGGQVKPPVLLRKGMTAAHYTELNGGELLFVESDNLYAQHLATGEPARLTGEPRKVLEGVYSTARLRQGFFTLSRNGVLVWTAGRAAKAQLTWFDRRGKALATAGPTCDAGSLSLAPDGRHILLTPMIGFSRIVETGREGYFPLPGVVGALWNPDGTRVTYIERGEHESRLMERAIGSGEVKELASYEGTVALKDLSPDGKVLLYTVNRALYARRIDASSRHAAPQQVTKVVAATVARFAPDGKRIAYTELSDRPRIYVQPFPSGGPRTEITTEGGNDPVWRRDGKEILYRWKGTIFSVRVDTRAGVFRAGQPEALFQVRTPPVVGTSQILDISRDGSRILFAQSMEASYPPPVYVMISWNDSGR